MKRFIGKENVSGISLQSLAHDKFVRTGLHNKHLNIYDEMSAKDIEDTGLFKMATGSSTIPGEYKFGLTFNFHNYAKMTFGCNKIPSIKDTDDTAYFSRWMVIQHENVFSDDNDDKHLLEKITTEKELSGLLFQVIEK